MLCHIIAVLYKLTHLLKVSLTWQICQKLRTEASLAIKTNFLHKSLAIYIHWLKRAEIDHLTYVLTHSDISSSN